MSKVLTKSQVGEDGKCRVYVLPIPKQYVVEKDGEMRQVSEEEKTSLGRSWKVKSVIQKVDAHWIRMHPVDVREALEVHTVSLEGPSVRMSSEDGRPDVTVHEMEVSSYETQGYAVTGKLEPDPELKEDIDFRDWDVDELREIAEHVNIPNLETMKKSDLVEALRALDEETIESAKSLAKAMREE